MTAQTERRKYSRGPWVIEEENKGRKVWYIKNETDVIAKVYNPHDAELIVELFSHFVGSK